MNAERLHAVVRVLADEMRTEATTRKMRTMVDALRTFVQSNNQNTQQNFVSAREALYDALTATASDHFSPAWRQILTEMDIEPFFGGVLKSRIEKLFADNQMTPAVPLPSLEKILENLQHIETNLAGLIKAFELFRIGDEELPPGSCEIGVLIPRKFVKNHFDEFTEELQEWQFIFHTFSEVVTGQIQPLEIKTLSSSDLVFYLEALPKVTAALAKAVSAVMDAYEKIRNLRKYKDEGREHGLPEEITQDIEKHASGVMEEAIDTISLEIYAEFYKQSDGHRGNELKIKVRQSITKIANRIDHGVNVEVRVAPLDAGEERPDADKEAIALIESVSAKMKFLKLEGEPILKLPERAGTTEEVKPERPNTRKRKHHTKDGAARAES